MSTRGLLLWIPILLSLGSIELAYAQTSPPQRGVAVAKAEPSSPDEQGPYFALVIGINDYHHLPKLNTAVNDAKAVATVLHDQYSFETTLLLNASRHEILSALDNYRRRLPDDANLLIYYAGHGFYDREMDKAYWAPAEAEKDTYADWIIADEITSRTKAIPARHILIVSDSCYSGMIGATREASPEMNPVKRRLYLDKMLRKKSRGVISSGGNEPVMDAGAPGHSLFADALLQGLSQIEEAAFTTDELFHGYVKVQVAGKSDQVPSYDVIRNSGDDFGDFLFFRLPSSTKLQPVSEDSTTLQPKDLPGHSQQTSDTREQTDWDAVKDSKDLQRLQAFLNAYPLGRYAGAAKAEIEARTNLAPVPRLRPEPQKYPDYCPLPDRIEFDNNSEHGDKLGVWTGAWNNPIARKFCIVLTSIKDGKVQGIYSSEVAPEKVQDQYGGGGYWTFHGKAKFSTASVLIRFTPTYAKTNTSEVVITIHDDGTAEAEWLGRSAQGRNSFLSAKPTRVPR